SLLAKSAPILPNCSVIERSARIEALSLALRFKFKFLFTKSTYFSSSILPPFCIASC
ncbi:toxin, partial [Campylobacter jejuni]|nr:toxin [Campylobacter jejuni]ECK2571060.1 toxin [Campylobacter jejuni]ECL0299739.1 toxin [Campylobacter jejuni]ECL2827136.1 toxin [Campylobacter jejuni]ECL4319266.1 toxin [Campylobacter jejuni]